MTAHARVEQPPSSRTAESTDILRGRDLATVGLGHSALQLVDLRVVELEQFLVVAGEHDHLSTFGELGIRLDAATNSTAHGVHV